MPEQPRLSASLPRIASERVAIRPPVGDELERLAEKIAADPQTSPWWGTDPAVVRRDLLDDPDYRVLVVEHQGEAAGVIAYEEETLPEYKSASIDIALLQCCVGRGLGSTALP